MPAGQSVGLSPAALATATPAAANPADPGNTVGSDLDWLPDRARASWADVTGSHAVRSSVSAVEARLNRQILAPGAPGLRAGLFGVDLATGSSFSVDGDDPFAAASLIKIPIVVALLAAAEHGRIDLDEMVTLCDQDRAAGSGRIQYLPAGSRFSIERLAELMIRASDNSATNMLVDRLGGMTAVNAIFERWDLGHTRIRNPLPDMNGTNQTSPRDLVTILDAAIRRGLLGPESRARLLAWMSRSHVRSMIPASARRGAFVANKTGDIPGALGDAGYVVAPGGHAYLLAVQVERPRNSPRAKSLIRSVSGTVWETITRTPSAIDDLQRSSPRRRPAPRSSSPSRARARAIAPRQNAG